MDKKQTEKKVLQDRIGEYLYPHTNDFLFDELSDNYLKKSGVDDILSGVPVPIKKTALSNLSTLIIAQNMAYIIGCDINFKYRDNYVAYIIRTFTVDFAKPLINEGIEAAAKGDFDYACICFRGALLIDPDSADALYCYGRACKDAYEAGSGEEYIGRYKAESLEAFEKLTLKKPDFDMGFYFLGYGYVNLGLYVKAKLTWETFMLLSENEEQKKEIAGWIEKLTEPVKIEEGYNLVLSGRYEEGITILSAYEEDSRFNGWWPLWYYLGTAHRGLAQNEDAKRCYLKVLQLSPSNGEAMEELVYLYEEEAETGIEGAKEKAEKYRKKIEVVKHNAQLDKAEKMNGLS